jgi:hypothetical protein
MTLRHPARIRLLVAVMTLASPAVLAGVWGSQPVVGLSGDYSTNPGLIDLPNTAEAHAALLVDAPTSYVGNAWKFTILPSVRLSNAQGYSSLDSDYEHLNMSGELDGERNVFTATVGVARDSSLYHDYILNGSSGVERNSVLADVSWNRQLTERLLASADLSSTQVRYGAATGVGTLTAYRYSSLAPSLAWTVSELGKLTVSSSVGLYDSLDGLTQSTSANVQLGYSKQLTELWSASLSGGYSRANNRADTFQPELVFTPEGLAVVLVPLRLESRQTGSIFAATVSRQDSLLLLSASASRQLAPTGFAYLSRQEVYELSANYPTTERLSFNADLRRIDYQQPEVAGRTSSVDVTSVEFNIAWQWTEQWTVKLDATRVLERYGTPRIGVDASGVSLEFLRRFSFKTLQ